MRSNVSRCTTLWVTRQDLMIWKVGIHRVRTCSPIRDRPWRATSQNALSAPTDAFQALSQQRQQTAISNRPAISSSAPDYCT